MYIVQLDISHEISDILVQEFATSHNCTATLIQEFGPAGGNPLYEFSSNNFESLKGLTNQYFGTDFDEEDIKTMIVEV